MIKSYYWFFYFFPRIILKTDYDDHKFSCLSSLGFTWQWGEANGHEICMTWWNDVWHYFVINIHAESIGANLGNGHYLSLGLFCAIIILFHWQSNLYGSPLYTPLVTTHPPKIIRPNRSRRRWIPPSERSCYLIDRRSIPHGTLLPLIFITGVHPPSPHPKSPMWQRTVVGCEPRWRVTSLLTFDLLIYKRSRYISNWLSYDANLYHLYLLNFLTDTSLSSVLKIQRGFNQLATSASPVSQKIGF